MYCTEARECKTSQPLQSYFKEINEVALLTAAEERRLADEIATGDLEARARLIRANLRLVVKIASEFLGRGLSLDDLIGEGNLGLIRAVEDYDTRFGTRFSTYASYWIKQSIRHALINTSRTVRLPAHMVQLLTRWRRAERQLTRENGGPVGFEVIADFLGLSQVQRLLVVKAKRANQLKLESGLGDEEATLFGLQISDDRPGPDSSLEASDERKDLERRMKCLDDRERSVLSLRFGLNGGSPLTLKEIGGRLGVTREWVRKIELRAVRKLELAIRGTPVEVIDAEKSRPKSPRREKGTRPISITGVARQAFQHAVNENGSPLLAIAAAC